MDEVPHFETVTSVFDLDHRPVREAQRFTLRAIAGGSLVYFGEGEITVFVVVHEYASRSNNSGFDNASIVISPAMRWNCFMNPTPWGSPSAPRPCVCAISCATIESLSASILSKKSFGRFATLKRIAAPSQKFCAASIAPLR